MTMGQTQTATIYAFPNRRRELLDSRVTAAKADTTGKAQPASAIGFGESWYHQAAIQDAARPQKA